MRKVLKNRYLNFVLFTFLLFIASACNTNKTSDTEMQYTCPMHPEIIKDGPSTCPICFMDLVPMHSNSDGEVDKEVEPLLENVNEVVFSDVKTIYPRTTTFIDTITLNGKLVYNTNNQTSIPSFINGRIEKLYVKYNFQKINKGQKLLEIYSPDLVNVQQEILYLLKSNDNQLLENAKNKLRLLGASESQISSLIATKKVNYKFPIYSKVNGYITDLTTSNAVNTSTVNSNTNNMSEMGGMGTSSPSQASSSSDSQTNQPLSIREGMYVKTGETLFKVYNDSKLWAEFYIPADKIKSVHKGSTIYFSKTEKHTVNSLIPYFKENQKFAIVRVDIPKGKYQVGQIINGKIISEPLNGMWVPKTAVYFKGDKKIVFVQSGKKLLPKEVITSHNAANMTAIKSGITDNDKIAENAAHLIDSEGIIPNELGEN